MQPPVRVDPGSIARLASAPLPLVLSNLGPAAHLALVPPPSVLTSDPGTVARLAVGPDPPVWADLRSLTRSQLSVKILKPTIAHASMYISKRLLRIMHIENMHISPNTLRGSMRGSPVEAYLTFYATHPSKTEKLVRAVLTDTMSHSSILGTIYI